MRTFNFKILLTGLVVLGLGFSSCMLNCVKGSGNTVSEDRKVEAFTALEASGDYKILLKQDSSFSLHITGDDNLLKYIKTNVSGDKLSIGSKRGLCSKKAITIIIGVANLEVLKGTGAIQITSEGKLNVKDIDIRLSGASKIDLDLNAANVNTKGSGATEIYLKGQATSHTLSLTGSGKIDALDFVVNKYDIQTTGASDCKINVLTDLKVHTTGAAEVQYRGNPANIDNSKSGASTLKKID